MSRKRTGSVRFAAVQVVHGLNSDKGSLTTLLPLWVDGIEDNEQPLLRELCFGVARWSEKLDGLIAILLAKPLRNKDKDVHVLLQIGLYQLLYMRVPEHAAINTTVAVATEMRKAWARGLVNGVLRNFTRERDTLDGKLDAAVALSFPTWLYHRIMEDWPDQGQSVLHASNERAPMVLRVNLRHQSRETYCGALQKAGIGARSEPLTASAVVLSKPCPVNVLPGFADGSVSVQDTSAQLAATLLAPSDGDVVLDACAAPGGKTCHLLERAEGATVVAIDSDSSRLERVRENCQRLSLDDRVTLKCADATDVDRWWDGQAYDAVLLDAPCSGMGVLRRHPDIKLLRRAADMGPLIELQQSLLRNLWRVLKPGGRLLYATCSVIKAENEEQIINFVKQTDDVVVLPVGDGTWGIDRSVGRQILPEHDGIDGFFYALLQKTAAAESVTKQ